MSGLSERSRHDEEMHREVAKMYRRRSTYPFAEAFQQERNDILLALAPANGSDRRALDLGCGTGLLLGRLSGRYRQIIGFDLSTEMLEGCQRGGDVQLVRGDMGVLPFATASIGVVFCRSALHHVDDEAAVLDEIERVLEPGGRLILAEPANDNPVARAARAWVKRRPSYGTLHTIDRAFTRRELRRLLDRAGLEVRRERRFGYLAYPLCDNPDLVPVLKALPFASAIGAGLRAIDRVLSAIPVVRTQSWYTILEVARRNERAA
jgi:ubiquinone/menaquinone biosynthesis C-methylase UbiE